MNETKTYKAIPDSHISLRGKTISLMRDIAKSVFMESFVSISLDKKQQLFIIVIEKDVSQRVLYYFIESNPQCRVKICEDAPVAPKKK